MQRLARAGIAAIVFFSHAAQLQAQDFPQRRAGLWEIQSAASQRAGLAPAQQCVGPWTDNRQMHLDRLPGKRGVCTIGPFERRGSAWVAESICKRGRHRIINRKIATGDFQTNYRIDTTVRHWKGRRQKPQVRDALAGRYLGPCEPGQRPDDLITPGMGTLNMTDGQFQAEPRKKRRRKKRRK